MKKYLLVVLMFTSTISFADDCYGTYSDDAASIEIHFEADLSHCSEQRYRYVCGREAVARKNAAYDDALSDFDNCMN